MFCREAILVGVPAIEGAAYRGQLREAILVGIQAIEGAAYRGQFWEAYLVGVPATEGAAYRGQLREAYLVGIPAIEGAAYRGQLREAILVGVPAIEGASNFFHLRVISFPAERYITFDNFRLFLHVLFSLLFAMFCRIALRIIRLCNVAFRALEKCERTHHSNPHGSTRRPLFSVRRSFRLLLFFYMHIVLLESYPITIINSDWINYYLPDFRRLHSLHSI